MEIEGVTQMVDVREADLSGSTFRGVVLADTAFDDVSFARARISNADLTGVVLSNCKLAGMRIDGVDFADLLAAYRAVSP